YGPLRPSEILYDCLISRSVLMFNKTLALALLPLCLLACSKVKKLDDMASDTKNLQQTTADMSKNTEHMDVMYRQVRSKETADTRLKEYNNLKSEDVMMQSKITSAAIYFMSQEYQLATYEELKGDHRVLNDLRRDTANDFTRKLGDLFEDVDLDKLDPTKSPKHRNNEMMFNALAAGMHYIHDHQQYLAERMHIPTVSVYDLVKNSLRKLKRETDARKAGRGVDHGVVYENYERIFVTGKARQVMLIELIKARVDMLAATALHYMTDKESMSYEQFAEALTFMISGGHFGKIDLPLVLNDTPTRDSVVEALDGALKAKRFLEKEMDIKKPLVKTLKSAYSQLDLKGDRELEKIQKQVEELLAE
ncbi:MAG: hypothetical protein ACJ76H_05915, partial [Bacteriovoracaceae bacterium]